MAPSISPLDRGAFAGAAASRAKIPALQAIPKLKIAYHYLPLSRETPASLRPSRTLAPCHGASLVAIKPEEHAPYSLSCACCVAEQPQPCPSDEILVRTVVPIGIPTNYTACPLCRQDQIRIIHSAASIDAFP
jgi:hypothetical protein